MLQVPLYLCVSGARECRERKVSLKLMAGASKAAASAVTTALWLDLASKTLHCSYPARGAVSLVSWECLHAATTT